MLTSLSSRTLWPLLGLAFTLSVPACDLGGGKDKGDDSKDSSDDSDDSDESSDDSDDTGGTGGSEESEESLQDLLVDAFGIAGILDGQQLVYSGETLSFPNGDDFRIIRATAFDGKEWILRVPDSKGTFECDGSVDDSDRTYIQVVYDDGGGRDIQTDDDLDDTECEIIVESLTAESITGTFTGKAGDGIGTVTITNGQFHVPLDF